MANQSDIASFLFFSGLIGMVVLVFVWSLSDIAPDRSAIEPQWQRLERIEQKVDELLEIGKKWQIKK